MKTLVVAATQMELAGLFAHFNLAPAGFTQAAAFDVLVTGVGMTATAYALGKYLSPDYSLVLNLGIAGSFDPALPLGSLVNIGTDEFAELGAEDHDHFLPIDQMGFGKSKYQNNYHLAHPALEKLRVVHGITVNKVHGNKRSIELLQERLSPLTESMEGAAVFYACEQEGIPCLQVRAISNYVEERNTAAWQIKPAIDALNRWAVDFLTKV